MKSFKAAVCGTALSVAAWLLFTTPLWPQESASVAAPGETATALRELQDQVRQLRTMVDQMSAENAQARAEMHRLREDLQATRALLEQPGQNATAVANAASPSSPGTSAPVEAAPLEQRVQKLEETTSLLGSKVDEQYQTKVETASKYRARLHGIVLMNAFRNVGGLNSSDLPDFSAPIEHGSPIASFGATLRQSEIGLEVFGPTLAGARSSADVQLDFAGGFPATGNGVNFGIVRLQTASLRLDWKHTSVVAGQDSLFISPLSPTSFASLATPTFGYAGNLWAWTPQLRVEHRFSLTDQQTVTVQAGILDNLNWEFPPDPFYRYAQAGERSGQPAYGVHTAWSRPVHEHPLGFGIAGYYGRQNWDWNRYVDAWAGMVDWQVPIGSRLSVSGEFYRGRGIGGLGASVGRSIVFGGDPSKGFTPIRGLNSEGGWAQMKIQLTPKLELNGVVSDDNTFAGDVRGFALDANNFVPILGRNRGALGNVIFRPRSDLLFSAELRRLQTFPIYSSSSFTNQINLAMGILF